MSSKTLYWSKIQNHTNFLLLKIIIIFYINSSVREKTLVIDVSEIEARERESRARQAKLRLKKKINRGKLKMFDSQSYHVLNINIIQINY